MSVALHITSGDIAGNSLSRSGIPGKCSSGTTYCMTAPEIPGWPDDGTLHARARFLEQATGGGLDRGFILHTCRTSTESLHLQLTMSGLFCGSTHACSISPCLSTSLRACGTRASGMRISCVLRRFPKLCRLTDSANSNRLNWLPCMIGDAPLPVTSFGLPKWWTGLLPHRTEAVYRLVTQFRRAPAMDPRRRSTMAPGTARSGNRPGAA